MNYVPKTSGLAAIFFIMSIGVSTALYSESSQSYLLTLSSKKGKSTEKMTVSTVKDGYTVAYTDAAGSGSVNHFRPDFSARQTLYLDSSRVEFMRLDFDQSAGKIVSSGSIRKTYDLESRVYDGNGALFYVFSKILPEKGTELIFNLLQSKEKRIVKMYLKYLRTETVLAGSKSHEAELYETGLVNRVLSLFWPYKYHYWYDAKTHEFLKYEGPVGHENSEIIQVE